MIQITRNQGDTITSTLEDTVSFLCEELAQQGELISGQTVYKVIHAYAECKLMEYTGAFNEVS